MQDLTVNKYAEYEKLGPFEIKDFLAKVATKSAQENALTYLNAGRGNPNWVATEPREGFFLLGQFAVTESKRVLDLPPGVGGMPKAAGIAGRLEAWLAKHEDMPGAPFLQRMVPWAVKKFGFDPDKFVHELVDSIIGDHYPVPDRMLVHNEQIVHEYLEWAMCGSPHPKGKFKIYAVEGGTAAMCYIFKSLKANRILNQGDTIALGVPIFTPYLEMAHLEDYDLHFVEVHAKQEIQFQYPDEELDKLLDPKIKAFFVEQYAERSRTFKIGTIRSKFRPCRQEASKATSTSASRATTRPPQSTGSSWTRTRSARRPEKISASVRLDRQRHRQSDHRPVDHAVLETAAGPVQLRRAEDQRTAALATTSPPTCGPRDDGDDDAVVGQTRRGPDHEFALTSAPGGGKCPQTLGERPFAPGFERSRAHPGGRLHQRQPRHRPQPGQPGAERGRRHPAFGHDREAGRPALLPGGRDRGGGGQQRPRQGGIAQLRQRQPRRQRRDHLRQRAGTSEDRNRQSLPLRPLSRGSPVPGSDHPRHGRSV